MFELHHVLYFVSGSVLGIIAFNVIQLIDEWRLHNNQLAADADRLERMRRNG